jgi:hypothetical protein
LLGIPKFIVFLAEGEDLAYLSFLIVTKKPITAIPKPTKMFKMAIPGMGNRSPVK